MIVGFFDTLTLNQRAEFYVEACSLVSAAKSMGIELELSDLKALAQARFEKQLFEVVNSE